MLNGRRTGGGHNQARPGLHEDQGVHGAALHLHHARQAASRARRLRRCHLAPGRQHNAQVNTDTTV